MQEPPTGPEVSPQPNKIIHSNAEFKSFNEFQKEFNEYCNDSSQSFSVVDSRENAIEDLQYGKYKYVHYKCQFHQNAKTVKTKSKGIRPIQSYTGCSCPAEIRIIFTQKKKDKVPIKSF